MRPCDARMLVKNPLDFISFESVPRPENRPQKVRRAAKTIMTAPPGRRKHPFSLLRKQSSPEDELQLFRSRQNSLVPLFQSPFEEKPPPPPEPEPKIHYRDDEYIVYLQRVPWSDLLLEIAMTTAFASLTDGTPLMAGSSVASYLSFFCLVWWVWASQVFYNVRFRGSDWMHRLFVFLQLLIFCALAAFTNNFDITNGIVNDTKEQKVLQEVQLSDYSTMNDIEVANFRASRLPTLNARGISITMAFSRLLLLSQYILAYFHAVKKDRANGQHRLARRSAFLIHIGSLVFSSICYFIAYGVIGKNPSEGDQIAKLALWYLPVVVEVSAHFVAAYFPGRVRYSADAIYERSATAFVIILGGGLDKITNGFQYIVGNVSIGFESFIIILCAAVIFILLFSLYFGTNEGDKLGSRRALALFLFNFFYLCALIVTLQGIASLLQIGNIGIALETPFKFVNQTGKLLDEKGFGYILNVSDYDWDTQYKLNKTGVSLASLLEFVNSGVEEAWNVTDYNLTYNFLLQADVYLIAAVLKNFNAVPDQSSLLYANLSAFYDNDPSNYTVVNNVTFHQLAQDVVITNATPALWFYAAGGLVLFLLAGMTLVNRMPRDKYEWGQTLSRMIVGSFLILLSALDVNASDDVLDQYLQYQGSRIWYLATHSWVLPPYALALFVEQCIELALLYLAGRSYRQTGFHVFFRRTTPIMPYTSTHTTEPGEMHPSETQAKIPLNTVYDPYASFDDSYDNRTHRVELNRTMGNKSRSSTFDEEKGEAIPLQDTATTPGYRQLSIDSWKEPLINRSRSG